MERLTEFSKGNHMTDMTLQEENERLYDLLLSRGMVLSRDGRVVFVEGSDDYDVETVEAIVKERDELRARLKHITDYLSD